MGKGRALESLVNGLSSAKPGRILVTGATGFVGSYIVPKLINDGWSVFAVGRDSTSWEKLAPDIKGEVRTVLWSRDIHANIETVKEINPDVVLHLATHFVGQHKPEDIDALAESNIHFGMQLAEACAATESDLVFINVGTIWQHADSKPYAPTTLYAATKQAFADILRFYSDYDFFRVINLKLTDSYGPNDPRRKLWSVLIETAKSGNPLDMSPGEQLIDPIYIDDIVSALLVAISLGQTNKNQFAEYRVAADAVTVREIVQRFQDVTGTTLNINWGAMPYRLKERFEPWEYGEMLPGWQPKVSLDEGIARIWKAAN